MYYPYSKYEVVIIYLIYKMIWAQESFDFFEKDIPGVFIVRCSDWFSDHVSTLVGQLIKILSIDDTFLEYFDQFVLLVVVLIEIILVFEGGALWDKSYVCKMLDVLLHEVHYNSLGIFVSELVVDEDGSDETFEDIAKDL